MNILLIYLALVNVVTLCCYGIDKWKAKHNRWRISEFTLLALAAAGGCAGAWMAMQMFRHKTKHWKFKIFVPMTLILWVIGIGYFLYQ